MFSHRIPWSVSVNPLTRMKDRKIRDGVRLLDLTDSNPTRVGLPVAPDLLGPLAQPASLAYEPHPAGLLVARQAIAGYYAGRGFAVDPGRLVLTASSSESYALLFKLLCEPGDEVLVPSPSYPLFEYLAGLEGVTTADYSLDAGCGWRIDMDELEQAIGPSTRAVVVVHPNNPTGTFLRRDELEGLIGLLAPAGIALIVDEVFADYPAGDDPSRIDGLAGEMRTLTFCLQGFSKLLGLPQCKLGWIAVNGPDSLCEEALRRLHLIADTYLSVNTPIQHAAPALLQRLPELRGRIADRLARNRATVLEFPELQPQPGEGGWCGLLQLPTRRTDEAWALHLLESQDVLAHPGYLFGFEQEAVLVVSLITPEPAFREGLRRIASACGGP